MLISDASRKWIEAAKVLTKDPCARVLCPERGDGFIEVRDQVSTEDASLMERWLTCDTCGASNVVRMRVRGES